MHAHLDSLVGLMLLAPTLKARGPVEEPSEFPLWIVFAGVALLVLGTGALILLLAIKKSKGESAPCGNCGKTMMPEWPSCMFCKMPRGFKGAALQMLSGELAGQTIKLESAVTTIGSAQGSVIMLAPTSGVSRKHAGIRKVEGGFELADLGSSNGVYVNGEKVAKKKLAIGDVIRIGTTEMVFKA